MSRINPCGKSTKIGQTIIDYLNQNNKNEEWFSQKTDISVTCIYGIVDGVYKPSLYEVHRIALLIGINENTLKETIQTDRWFYKY